MARHGALFPISALLTSPATTIAADHGTTGAGVTATVLNRHFNLTMSFEDAATMLEALASYSSLRTALQRGIATGLSIDSSMVEVTSVSFG